MEAQKNETTPATTTGYNPATDIGIEKLKSSRFDYVAYDEYAQKGQELAKILCQKLESSIENLPTGRAKSLALTRLEETYMWIGKAIRDDQISRNGSAPLQESRNNS